MTQRVLAVYTWALLFFLALPVLVIIPVSFNPDSALAFPPRGFSLRWYQNILQHPELIEGLVTSAAVAVLASLLVLVVGSLSAYALVRFRLPGSRLVGILFLTPLSFPSVVYGLSMLMFLTPMRLNMTLLGLVLAHGVVTFPYVVRTVTAALYGYGKQLEEAAESLGASPLRVFRYIVLPLIRPGLIAGSVFSLLMSFDEFTVSLFLTGGHTMTLPIRIYQYIQFVTDPTVVAVTTILVLVSLAVLVLIERYLGLARYFKF